MRFLFSLPLTLIFFQAQSQLTADFTSNLQSGCSPLIVQFKDASLGATSWKWDFDNGATSTIQNPSIVFINPGFYSITLNINNGAATITKKKYVQVYARPQVRFGASATSICAPQEIFFTDSSISSAFIKDWQWNFGDSTAFSYQQNPSHVYTKGGNFNVSLRVTDTNGCTQNLTQINRIVAGPPSTASFTYTTSDVCTYPATINFKSNSLVPDTLYYQWSFGDGKAGNQPDVSHQYLLPGYYKVTLTTANYTNVTCQHTQSQYISIAPPLADFTVPASLCSGAALTFKDSSTPKAGSVSWNFGDGSKGSGLSVNHTYAKAGTYTVTQTADFGACNATRKKTITVGQAPSLGFTASGNLLSCNNSENISFTNQSSGANKYQWFFGDGKTDVNSSTTHTYNNPGNYDVKLVGYTNNGCADTLTKKMLVQLSAFKIHNIQPLPVAGCAPATVNFSAVADNKETIKSYQWDLGDGKIVTDARPSYTYLEPGGYTISLIIQNAAGCRDTFKYGNGVALGLLPKANFTTDSIDACASSSIPFKDLSSGTITNWLWDFGDSTFSSTQNPVHQYSDTGFFSVKLTVYSYGCTNGITKSKLIHIKPPIANFSVNANCNNHYDFTFIDSSKGALINKWDFGDGSVSFGTSPEHIYKDTGIFLVTLKTANGACSYTKSDSVYVTTKPADISYLPLKSSFCKYDVVQLYAFNFNPNYISSTNWIFGDGLQTGTQPGNFSVNHQYIAIGDYNGSLITRSIYGCYDTMYEPKPIHITGPTASFFNDSLTVCGGTPSFFKDLSTTGDDPIIKWEWDFGDGNKLISPKGSVSHQYIDTGFYTVRLKVTDSGGCFDSLVRYNSLQVQSIKLDLTPDTAICAGTTATLSAYGGETYSWQPAADVSCASCDTVIVAPKVSTTYTVNVTKAGGCDISDTVRVFVQQPQKVTVKDHDSTCAGESVNLSASGTDVYKWVPLPSGSGPVLAGSPVTITPDTSVRYMVVGTDTLGCFSDTGFINIKVNPIPEIVFTQPKVEILSGGSYNLFPMVSPDANRFTWSPDTALSCIACKYPVATPASTTSYTITALNRGNCSASGSITIQVLCNKNNVFIPNTFSPNNDGKNDRFFIQGRGLVKVTSFKIFNRWGQLMFSSGNLAVNDPAAAWDGKYKSNLADAGVYVYNAEIECENNQKVVVKGNITLLR